MMNRNTSPALARSMLRPLGWSILVGAVLGGILLLFMAATPYLSKYLSDRSGGRPSASAPLSHQEVESFIRRVQRDNNGICKRDSPYSLQPEFVRAISLLKQRFSQAPLTGDQDYAHALSQVENCLNIRYSSETDRLGAHGVFYFTPQSSPDNLEIFVSPSYSAKDDILTAILLSHEIRHAIYFATGRDKQISCFQNEADAFEIEGNFIANLNPEEKASVTARADSDPASLTAEAVGLLVTIMSYPGKNHNEQALNYVASQPYYQEQCRGRHTSP